MKSLFLYGSLIFVAWFLFKNQAKISTALRPKAPSYGPPGTWTVLVGGAPTKDVFLTKEEAESGAKDLRDAGLVVSVVQNTADSSPDGWVAPTIKPLNGWRYL